MFGSGFLAQSEYVFLHFSINLVLFNSNFFELGAIFFSNQPFLIFEKGFLVCGNFPPGNWYFLPSGKKASCSQD
jgi:hypothetical protein